MASVSGREITQLALPALAALLAEPVFLLIDTAIIGHLGLAQLAGVGVAATIISTAVGLTIFLAYSATAQVARGFGAGQTRRALGIGMDSVYLAGLIGTGLAVTLLIAGKPVINWLGADPQAAWHGLSYLSWSLPGLPGMLVVLATTGVLRGLLDTRTPMLVAIAGAVLNTALSLLLVLGLDLGVAGSAIGTSVTQTLMGLTLLAVVVRHARAHGARLRPNLRGIGSAGGAGIPLLMRTLALRVGIVATTMAAARLGQLTLAGHHIVATIWNFLALALDALAIAAQALVGRALGAGDARAVRETCRQVLTWSLAVGAALAVLLAAGSPWLPMLFTPDPAVRQAVGWALLVLAAAQLLAGYVFCLDGVLIGAGDGRYLAWAGWAALGCYLPVVWAVARFAPAGPGGLMWLWAGYVGVYLGARAVTLGLRYRRDSWLVTGA